MSRKPENHGKKKKRNPQGEEPKSLHLGHPSLKASLPKPLPWDLGRGRQSLLLWRFWAPLGAPAAQSPPGAAFTRNFPVPSPVPTSLSHSDPHGAPASAAPKRGPPLPEPKVTSPGASPASPDASRSPPRAPLGTDPAGRRTPDPSWPTGIREKSGRGEARERELPEHLSSQGLGIAKMSLNPSKKKKPGISWVLSAPSWCWRGFVENVCVWDGSEPPKAARVGVAPVGKEQIWLHLPPKIGGINLGEFVPGCITTPASPSSV